MVEGNPVNCVNLAEVEERSPVGDLSLQYEVTVPVMEEGSTEVGSTVTFEAEQKQSLVNISSIKSGIWAYMNHVPGNCLTSNEGN